MSRHFVRPVIVGAILMLLLSMTALPIGAAAHQLSGINPAGFAPAQHAMMQIHPNGALLSGDTRSPHYLYVEDGWGPRPYDTIDVYKIGRTLTHVGNYPTDSNNGSGAYGAQKLAIAKQDRAHGTCLILIDTSLSGFVDSFAIHADGSLSAEVSHVITFSHGSPFDVHVAGDTAYVAIPGLDLESFGIGAGCVLTFLSRAPASNILYYTFALVGSTRLVAVDNSSGNIDTFALGAGGSITYLASAAGQISSPQGVAVQRARTRSGLVINVFTGQATTNPPQAQGGQYNTSSGALAFLTGSPTSDSSGLNGAAVTFDNTDSLLIQGEQNSASLGVFKVSAGVPGMPGSMSFLEHTTLAVSSDRLSDFAQLGKTLFVDGGFNGDIEACKLSSGGASGCAIVAALTYTNGFSDGMVIL